MKVNVEQLEGAALATAVAIAEGYTGEALACRSDGHWYSPPTDWAQGGPIIEREHLTINVDDSGVWLAWSEWNYGGEREHMHSGPTPLIAAMRCYVASKLGDEINLPEEFKA